MIKIIMLGTGNGGVLNLYNTCFDIQNEKGDFLIDTGGSIEIVKRLNELNIKTINNIFISHCHNDHVLGLIWLFKNNFKSILDNKWKLNIYCNSITYDSILNICKYTMPKVIYNAVKKNINFIILKYNDSYVINGIEYNFINLFAPSTLLFGFTCKFNNKKLAFLGDELINAKIKDKVKNYDYVMHEVFCLDSEKICFYLLTINILLAKKYVLL